MRILFFSMVLIGKTLFAGPCQLFYDYVSNWNSETVSVLLVDMNGNGKTDISDFISQTECWSFQTQYHIDGSPAIVADQVVFGSRDLNLYNVDFDSGIMNWSFFTGFGDNSPTIVDGVYLYCGGSGVHRILLYPGALVWKKSFENTYISSPVAKHPDLNRLYVWGDKLLSRGTYYFLKDVDNGAETHRSYLIGSEYMSAPTLNEFIIYGASGLEDEGTIFCSSNNSLAFCGFSNLDARPTNSLTYVNEKLIYADNLGRVGCLDSNLNLVWIFDSGSPIYGSAASVNGHIFIGNDKGSFFALDLSSGEVIWQVNLEGRIRSSPAIAEGFIYFGTTTGEFYCFSIEGQEMWKTQVGGPIYGSPGIANGFVFIGSRDGKMYKLKAQTQAIGDWPMFQHNIHRTGVLN